MAVKVVGGDKLKQALKNVRAIKETNLEYGFYPNSTYEDGTKVAAVANWNEFGTKKIPERPFFRHAISVTAKKIPTKFKQTYSRVGGNYRMLDHQFEVFGEVAINDLQASINSKGISYEGNADSTIKAKGSSKPLIGKEGLLLKSPMYKIKKGF